MRPAGPWERFFPKILVKVGGGHIGPPLLKVPVIVPVMAVGCFLYVQDNEIKIFEKFRENRGSWGLFSEHFVKKDRFSIQTRLTRRKNGNCHQNAKVE